MATEHPLAPPPELVREWLNDFHSPSPGIAPGEATLHIAAQAARWGADAELEACCELLSGCQIIPPDGAVNFAANKLEAIDRVSRFRAARRPKPPSLAEEALDTLKTKKLLCFDHPEGYDIIHRALKRLQELENNG